MSPASTWLVLHRTPRGWIRRRRAHKGPLRYRVLNSSKVEPGRVRVLAGRRGARQTVAVAAQLSGCIGQLRLG